MMLIVITREPAMMGVVVGVINRPSTKGGNMDQAAMGLYIWVIIVMSPMTIIAIMGLVATGHTIWQMCSGR